MASVEAKAKRLPVIAETARERFFLWRRRAATVAAGALALVMAYGVMFGHNGITTFEHKREEARSLQLQLDELQKENDRLGGKVDELRHSNDAIEREAHEELHYTRPGEVIYTLPQKSGAATAQPAQ